MSPAQKKKASSAKAKPRKSPAKLSQAKAKPVPVAKKTEAQGGVNVLVWLHAKKGKEASLARALKSLVGPSRAEPGCLVFDLHHSADRPGDFFLHEVWTSDAALANHRLTPHFKHWSGLQGAILESRRRYLAE